MSVGNRTRAETASSRGYTLVDVLDSGNLSLAWQRVKANRGAAGIDGMGVGDFPAFMREHWEKLANILLDELDDQLEERGHSFVRYADDFVILCRSQRAGERILRSITAFLADRLKLVVNGAKSRVVKLAEASFLGFQIVRRKVRWTARSQKKFKARVRLITRRTRGHSPKVMIAELGSYLRGAFNYYEEWRKVKPSLRGGTGVKLL